MHAAVWVVVFADVLGVVGVSDVDDDVLIAVGERKQVVISGEHVVYAASDSVRFERRSHPRMRRVGHVENHHAVATVRSSLSRKRGVPPVRRNLYVVDRACVHLNRVGLGDVGRVRNVPEICPARGGPCPGDRVVAPVHPFEDPQVGGVDVRHGAASLEFDLLDRITAMHEDALTGRQWARNCEDGVAAGHFRHERPIVNDRC